MAIPSSLKEEEAGGGEGVPERHEDPELLLAPGDTDERPPHAPVQEGNFNYRRDKSFLKCTIMCFRVNLIEIKNDIKIKRTLEKL